MRNLLILFVLFTFFDIIEMSNSIFDSYGGKQNNKNFNKKMLFCLFYLHVFLSLKCQIWRLTVVNQELFDLFYLHFFAVIEMSNSMLGSFLNEFKKNKFNFFRFDDDFS